MWRTFIPRNLSATNNFLLFYLVICFFSLPFNLSCLLMVCLYVSVRYISLPFYVFFLYLIKFACEQCMCQGVPLHLYVNKHRNLFLSVFLHVRKTRHTHRHIYYVCMCMYIEKQLCISANTCMHTYVCVCVCICWHASVFTFAKHRGKF